MTDQLAHSGLTLAQLVPLHALPDNLGSLHAACLAAGWAPGDLLDYLASLSWAGRGPGWTAAVLRRLAHEGPVPDRPDPLGEDERRTARRPVTADPGLRGLGLGRMVREHPYASSDGPYCARCQLPARNAVHA